MPDSTTNDAHSTLDAQVGWHLLRRVYGNEAVACLFTMLVATVLGSVVAAYAAQSRIPVPVAWWLVMAAIALLRVVTARRFQADAAIRSAAVWRRRHLRNSSLAGLAWGIGGGAMFLLVPVPQSQMATLIVIAAMTASAVTYQAVLLRSYQSYLLGAVIPMAAVLAFSPQAGTLDLALLSLIYGGAMWAVAGHYSRDLSATTRTGYELRNLTRELADANRRLESDIDARLRAENLLSAERNVLENVTRDLPLRAVLDELNLDMEALFPGSLYSIVLLNDDNATIEHGSAPSLPDTYIQALQGSPIVSRAGGCGTVMHRAEQVIVENIAEDPLWVDYRELALAHDLRACWSTPITARSGDILGSFTVYRRTPQSPSAEELEAVNRMSRLIALVIEDIRNSDRIQLSEQRFRDFADAAADWFWEMDSSLAYTYASERFDDRSAWPGRQVLEKTREKLREVIDRGATESGDPIPAPADAGRSIVLEFTVTPVNRPAIEVLTMVKPVFEARSGLVGWRGIGRDVTRERELEREIRHQATHDSLTGLLNRREFDRRVRELLARDSQAGHRFVAFIDLDHFKLINDNAGHHAGDAVLRYVADVLRANLPGEAALGRLGGDEFGASFTSGDIADAMDAMQNVVDTLARARFDWSGPGSRVGASIGLVAVTPLYKTSAQVLSDADASCYRAKSRGGSQVCAYQPDLDVFTEDTRSTGELIRALKNDRTVIHVQRILAIPPRTERVPWYEILLRYTGSGAAVSSPSSLIPAAERYGQMGMVDMWVLEQALERWGGMLTENRLRLSINLSATSIAHGETADQIARLVEQARLAPGALCFELTETSSLISIDAAARFMRDLRSLGCGFVIDNFGSGQSNFAYLKGLPGDYVAIDGGYVKGMTGDAANHAIVDAIHKVGRAHGMLTLAKCVESQATLDALRGIGIDYAQGRYIGAVAPASDLDPGRLPATALRGDAAPGG